MTQMPNPETGSTLAAVLVAAALLAGAVTGLRLLGRARLYSRSDWRAWTRHLRQTPWRDPDAWLLLLFLTWIVLPAFLAQSTSKLMPAPDAIPLMLQGLMLHGFPLLLIGWRLMLRGKTPREAFAPCSPPLRENGTCLSPRLDETPRPTIRVWSALVGRTVLGEPRHNHPMPVLNKRHFSLGDGQAAMRGFWYALALFWPTLLCGWGVNRLIESLGIPTTAQPVIQWVSDPTAPMGTKAALVVLAVVIAPLSEELVFRGVLFPVLLQKGGALRAALLISLLFGAIHLHGASLLPLTVLSLGLCAGYLRTGHILTPIVMHATLNALNLLALSARL